MVWWQVTGQCDKWCDNVTRQCDEWRDNVTSDGRRCPYRGRWCAGTGATCWGGAWAGRWVSPSAVPSPPSSAGRPRPASTSSTRRRARSHPGLTRAETHGYSYHTRYRDTATAVTNTWHTATAATHRRTANTMNVRMPRRSTSSCWARSTGEMEKLRCEVAKLEVSWPSTTWSSAPAAIIDSQKREAARLSLVATATTNTWESRNLSSVVIANNLQWASERVGAHVPLVTTWDGRLFCDRLCSMVAGAAASTLGAGRSPSPVGAGGHSLPG